MAELICFVHDDVTHNGRRLGLAGFRAMLESDVAEIPDLRFDVELLIARSPYVASRIRFDCSPKDRFLGLDIRGRRVSFHENVFYEFRGTKIAHIVSAIDKAGLEAQL